MKTIDLHKFEADKNLKCCQSISLRISQFPTHLEPIGSSQSDVPHVIRLGFQALMPSHDCDNTLCVMALSTIDLACCDNVFMDISIVRWIITS